MKEVVGVRSIFSGIAKRDLLLVDQVQKDSEADYVLSEPAKCPKGFRDAATASA